MSFGKLVMLGWGLVLVLELAGCATPRYIQFRMAEPVVLPDDTGRLNPPAVVVQQYKSKIEKVKENGVYREYVAVKPRRCGSEQKAVIAWENPAEPVRTRVELRENSAYHVQITLPEDFEYRRMAVLRTKAETLYTAIEDADARLRQDTEGGNRLLSVEARQVLIDQCSEKKVKLDRAKVDLVQGGQYQEALQRSIDTLAGEIATIESQLRADDLSHDQFMPQFLVDSLVNQMEDWRSELNLVKSRIVALELMVNNPNHVFPRVITGWIETREQTPFTTSGALPFVLEDEYLDWIRQDKVVTIVSYDPNQAPTNVAEADRRATLPEYWPSGQLMVIELGAGASTVPRDARGGTAINTRININNFNVVSQTFRGDNGYLRTYLHSQDGKKMWVFGPDLTPPANAEVWLQDANGLPVQKLYPPDARQNSQETFVSQIAGVEGGAFDPVREAEKRGRVVAVTRLGNKVNAAEERYSHGVRAREVNRAINRLR